MILTFNKEIMSIWNKKPLQQLLNEATESEKGLKRTLTAWSLVALGIGAIIGAGLFVRTATAAALTWDCSSSRRWRRRARA